MTVCLNFVTGEDKHTANEILINVIFSEILYKVPIQSQLQRGAAEDSCPWALLCDKGGSDHGWTPPWRSFPSSGTVGFSLCVPVHPTVTAQTSPAAAGNHSQLFLPGNFRALPASENSCRFPPEDLPPFSAQGAALPQSPQRWETKSEILRNSCYEQGIQLCLHFAPFPPAQLQGCCGQLWFANTWTTLRTNLPHQTPLSICSFHAAVWEATKMGKMNHFTQVPTPFSAQIHQLTPSNTNPSPSKYTRVGRFIYLFGVAFRVFIIVFLRVTNWGLC